MCAPASLSLMILHLMSTCVCERERVFVCVNVCSSVSITRDPPTDVCVCVRKRESVYVRVLQHVSTRDPLSDVCVCE